jgi:hypothetical protein
VPTFPRCRLLFVLPLAAAVLLPASALADGGPSIAAAPAIVFGQQEFGNTATGGVVPDGCGGDFYTSYRSYWLLSASAGDQLTIDWEAQANNTELDVFPVGTTDFNVDNANTLEYQRLNPSGRNELVFSVSSSGVLPTSFRGCGDVGNAPGPYDFTAYVRHVVRLALPPVSKLRRSGTLRVAAHTAEGGVITDPNLLVDVQLRSGGRWRTIGSAAVVNSIAAVPVRIAARFAGKRVTLRALAHGGAYLSTATRSRRVLILDRSTPKYRKRRSRKRGH